MAKYTARLIAPATSDKNYIHTSAGGYNYCILVSGKSVLPNCVGYACGRFNEIIGSMKYPQLCCNAENFIERAKQYGLEISDVPTLGGIMVWQKGATLKGSDGAGHVEAVERIDSSNQIYTSASNWGGTTFYNAIRNNSNGRWGLSSGYKFRGCIVNPSIGKITAGASSQTDPFPNVSDEELACRVWTGEFGNGDVRRAKLGSRYSAVQALVDRGVGKQSTTVETKPAETKVDILTLVKKTIRGDFGNGSARRKALGDNYDEVQRQVNLNYKNGTTRWDNIKLY